MMNARSSVPAMVLDALLVIVFAGLGRNSHALELTIGGVLATAWPFLVALAASWVVLRAWRSPVDPIRTGIPLWIGTAVIGMIIRVLFTEHNFVWPFFLVALGTVGLMLVGWRALAALFRRRSVTPPR